MIEELVCDEYELTTYDLLKQCDDLTRMNEYGIHKIPAIVVNGELLNYRKDLAITEEGLMKAGLDQN